jgi:hypothetical protein
MASTNITQNITDLSTRSKLASDKLKDLGGGLVEAYHGFEKILGVVVKYTVALEDSARLLQRNTNLMGSNLDDFKKYNRGLQDQSFLYSRITGQSLEQSQKSVSAFQSALKTFDIEPTINLTKSQLIDFNDVMRGLAEDPTNELLREEYKKISSSMSQSDKDLFAFEQQVAGLGLRANLSGEDVAKFITTMKGTLDLNVKDMTDVSTLFDSVRQHGVQSGELLDHFSKYQEITAGLDESARKAQLTILAQGAADIKRAGVDFSKGADKIAGEEGMGMIESAAILASTTGGNMDDILNKMTAAQMGDVQAQKELNELQLKGQAEMTGISAKEASNAASIMAEAIAARNEGKQSKYSDREIASAQDTVRQQRTVGAEITKELFGGRGMTFFEANKAQQDIERSNRRGQAEGVGIESEDQRNQRNADLSGMQTMGEQVTSAETLILSKMLPDNMAELDLQVRTLASTMELINRGADVLRPMLEGTMGIGKGTYKAIDSAVTLPFQETMAESQGRQTLGGNILGGLLGVGGLAAVSGLFSSEDNSGSGEGNDMSVEGLLEGKGRTKGDIQKTQDSRSPRDMPSAPSRVVQTTTEDSSAARRSEEVTGDRLLTVIDVLEDIAGNFRATRIRQE